MSLRIDSYLSALNPRGWLPDSTVAFDHFLHDLPPSHLQWPHTATGQEPHTFVLVAAIEKIDAVAGRRVMECGAAVFGKELKESLPPGMVGLRKKLLPQFLELFDTNRANGFGDRLAAICA